MPELVIVRSTYIFLTIGSKSYVKITYTYRFDDTNFLFETCHSSLMLTDSSRVRTLVNRTTSGMSTSETLATDPPPIENSVLLTLSHEARHH